MHSCVSSILKQSDLHNKMPASTALKELFSIPVSTTLNVYISTDIQMQT